MECQQCLRLQQGYRTAVEAYLDGERLIHGAVGNDLITNQDRVRRLYDAARQAGARQAAQCQRRPLHRIPNIPAEFAQYYDTTGVLKDPMVTVHTLADPIVPYWQEPLYAIKAATAHSSSELGQIPVLAYGHCNISSADAEAAVALLLLKAAL